MCEFRSDVDGVLSQFLFLATEVVSARSSGPSSLGDQAESECRNGVTRLMMKKTAEWAI